MKKYSSINSKTLGKLLKRYKLTTRGKQEIIRAIQKRSITSPSLNKISRKIDFKETIPDKNKQL